MEPFIECYVLLDLKRKVTDQFSSETFKNSDPHSQNTVRENIRMTRSLKLWDLENKTNMWMSLISIPLFLLINVLVIKSLAKYNIFVKLKNKEDQIKLGVFNEEWKMNVVGWWFQAVEGFCFQTDKRIDICDCRVAFVTEKSK